MHRSVRHRLDHFHANLYTNNQSVSNLMPSIKLCDIAANVRAKRERRIKRRIER